MTKEEKKFTLTESELKSLMNEYYEKGLVKGQPLESNGSFEDAKEYTRKSFEELLGLDDDEGVK